MNLVNFLQARVVQKGDDFTHTCLLRNKSYDIRKQDLETFYDLYASAMMNSERLCLTERHKTIAPILIDLDFRQETQDRLYDRTYINTFLTTLTSTIREYVAEDEMTIILLEKPTPRQHKTGYKDGIHIVIPDIITTPAIQYTIRTEIIDKYSGCVKVHGMTNDIHDIYDEAVIERNNWFMYGSCKPDEAHPWSVTLAVKMCNGVVQNIDTSTLDLVRILSIRRCDLDESRYTAKGRQCTKRQSTNSNAQNHSLARQASNAIGHDIAKKLVALLSTQRSNSYDDWMRVGWCLHNIDDTLLNTWIEFSRKSFKFVDGECEKLWDTMSDGGHLTIASLHYWAKQDSPEEYLELMISQQEATLDDAATKTLNEMWKSSVTVDYNVMKRVFEKTHAKILNPLCFMTQTDAADTTTSLVMKDEATFRKTYRNLYCTKHCVQANGEEVKKKVKFIDAWLDDNDIRTYTHTDFCPPPLTLRPDVYNMWQGFQIDRVECASSGNVEPFIDHMKLLTGYDEACYQYFLKWLAHLVQFPGKLNGIALIFLSDEGAGKNIFWDKFAGVMGEQYYFETADPSKDLFGRFSNGRKNKLLIDIDEAQSKDTFANSELLKNMITSERFNYEVKGVSPMSIKNFARVAFTTNNVLCAKITDNTRRYVIFETSNSRIGDSDYFTGFATYMQEDSNKKAVIEFLRSIDISKVNWIRDRPLTSTYKALRQVCADPILKYLGYICTINSTVDTMRMTSSEMLSDYHNYLETELKMKDSIHQWNCTLFGLKLSKLATESVGINKVRNIGKQKQNGYNIEVPILREYLRSKGVLEDGTQ